MLETKELVYMFHKVSKYKQSLVYSLSLVKTSASFKKTPVPFLALLPQLFFATL